MKALKYLPLLLGFVAASCTDEVGPKIYTDGVSGQLSAPATGKTYTFIQENANEVAETFTWSSADFGTQLVTTYTVQAAIAGTNFEDKVVPLAETVENSAAVLVKDFNNKVLSLGLPFNKAANLQIRIKASVHANVNPVYSEPIDVTVTPFEMIINYPKIWVPGSFTGWGDAHKNNIVAYSIDDNGIYENYFFVNSTNAEYKFTRVPDWKEEIGYGDAEGKLKAGGGNIKMNNEEVGVYLMKANLNTMTYENTFTNWGLIGDAVGGWDPVNDVEMTWNKDINALEATVAMVKGNFKFRANKDWGPFEYGKGNNDGELKLKGGNIAVEKAGTYKVTFFIMEPVKKYTIEEI